MQKPSYPHPKHRVMALLAAMAALIAGGCTQTDEPDADMSARENAVAFGAYVSTTSGSRATESNIKTLKNTGFGVFAAISWDDDFLDAPTATAGYMYNQKIEWKGADDGNGSWVYDPVMLWPGKNKVSFFAYAPYAAQATSAITGWSDIKTPGSPTLNFKLDSRPENQTDLLYANAMNLINSPQVALNFKHALSRISIKFANNNDIAPKSILKIKNLTVSSTNLGTAGTLELASGTWSGIKHSTVSHLYYDPSSKADSIAMKNGFMAIPDTEETEIKITAKYTLTTEDDKLTTGSFTTENEVSGNFSIKLEAGKLYSLTLRLTLNAVEVTTSVTDWNAVGNYTWESDQSHDNKLETTK